MTAPFIPVANNYLRNITIKPESCVGCQFCIKICPGNDVIGINEENKAVVLHSEQCLGCFKCLKACPTGAIRPIMKRKTVEMKNN